MKADFDEAKRFLSLLDDQTKCFTFLTFDENVDRKSSSLTRSWHGSLEGHWLELEELNRQGAGVFVCINETDGKGRKKENITKIRSLWVDDDGAGKKPEFSNFSVETSPGKYHHYVLVENLDLDDFEGYQQRLVNEYNGDVNARDRSRVLRLPGFFHQKVNAKKNQTGSPHLVQIVEFKEFPRYDSNILEMLLPRPPEKKNEALEIDAELLTELRSAMSAIDLGSRNEWIATGSALKSIGENGYSIWQERSAECDNYKSEEDCRSTWEGLRFDRTGYKAIFSKAKKLGWINPRSKLAKARSVFGDNSQRAQPEKTLIYIDEGTLESRVLQAAKSLSNMNPPLVYQRGYELVEVVHSSGQCTSSGIFSSATIRPLSLAAMRVLLSETAIWIRGSSHKLCNPCDKVTAGLLESPSKWGGIPELAGITEVPILKTDGQLITEVGYEPESMLYVSGPIPNLNVSAFPTKEDAISASKKLLEVFSEFPFANPELDQSVLLAYILTLAIRHEIATAPLFGIDASTPGSGKDLLAACVFQTKPATDSRRKLPPIPRESCH